MDDATNTREKILKKVRKALTQRADTSYLNIDLDSGLFKPEEESLELLFAREFTQLNGQFVYCIDTKELQENLSIVLKDHTAVFCFDLDLKKIIEKTGTPIIDRLELIDKVNIAVTTCECLVARTGSIVVSSGQAAGRKIPFYANIHIVVANVSQLVLNTKDTFNLLKEKYNNKMPGMITHISGPSRTADIEQTLVQGVHGPQQLYCFLVDDTL